MLEEERHRERVLRVRVLPRFRSPGRDGRRSRAEATDEAGRALGDAPFEPLDR